MTTRDMTAPNWKRTVTAARRKIEELRALGVACQEPADFDTPPDRRPRPTPNTSWVEGAELRH